MSADPYQTSIRRWGPTIADARRRQAAVIANDLRLNGEAYQANYIDHDTFDRLQKTQWEWAEHLGLQTWVKALLRGVSIDELR